MEHNDIIEPDLEFIAEVKTHGGGSLKKCMQCATCSVACNLSPELQPFPRKEMLHAGWGLKDRLIGNPDIWQCYNCGDCSERCPRGANPGETLKALRHLTIRTYAGPAFFNRLMNEPKFIPLLIFFPIAVILTIGWLTGWIDPSDGNGPIVYAEHFPVLLIEIIFIPLTIMVASVFFLGINRMLGDMQKKISPKGDRKRNLDRTHTLYSCNDGPASTHHQTP